jgi:acyl-CoA thioesterase I
MFKLVMLGDSLTSGYGVRPEEAIPSRLEAALKALGRAVRVVNAGAAGDTSADVLGRLEFSVSRDADGVLVAVGGNDMLRGLPPEQLRANLNAIVSRLKARGVRTALAGMRAPENLGASYRGAFEAAFAGVARAHAAPLYPFLLEGVALNPKLNQADGIHPNAQGARIIADRLAPFVIAAFKLAQTAR